eukprot:767544-Hanusia_phi.AAC.1
MVGSRQLETTSDSEGERGEGAREEAQRRRSSEGCDASPEALGNEGAGTEMRRRRRAGVADGMQVLNALAQGEEERKEKKKARAEEMEKDRIAFNNTTKEWQEKLKGQYKRAGERGLLMHSVARRLRAEATKKFKEYLLDNGMSDLALEVLG